LAYTSGHRRLEGQHRRWANSEIHGCLAYPCFFFGPPLHTEGIESVLGVPGRPMGQCLAIQYSMYLLCADAVWTLAEPLHSPSKTLHAGFCPPTSRYQSKQASKPLMFQTTAQIGTGQSVIRSHFRAPLGTVLLLPCSVTRVLYREWGRTRTTLIPECIAPRTLGEGAGRLFVHSELSANRYYYWHQTCVAMVRTIPRKEKQDGTYSSNWRTTSCRSWT
jgi:hypothetical protein